MSLNDIQPDDRHLLLLVDDSEVNQELWTAILEAEGYAVVTARQGFEALEVVDQRPVDLVLLDVVMPGLSGFEVLETVRKSYSPEKLPVIMATSKDHKDDVVRAFGLGANDYVTKPLDREVTLARIAAQLRQKRPTGDREPSSGRVSGLFTMGPEGLRGEVLDGKYRIEEMLGHGNFGAVFRATHLALERPVALKVLRSSFRPEAVSLQRFRQEGVSLSRLQHPNVVHVLDFSAQPEGLTYLVMELLQGHDLDSEIRRKGRLDVDRTLEIALPICDVLDDAHALGIIHRDIKPQNVFLHRGVGTKPSGRSVNTGAQNEIVKVLDFGIAKLVGDTELEQRLTAEGNSVGTPAYMAPERFTEEPYAGASDVYSLGVMLYEMLTGQPTFAEAGNSFFKLIRLHVAQPPRPLRDHVADLPRALDEIVLSALEKNPSDRPEPAELASRLAEVSEAA